MLKGHESPVIREIRGPRHRIRLDLSQQVLHLSVPDDSFVALATGAGEETIHPTLRDLPLQQGGFVPAGLLVQKAKQFDDGLYAAVELAAEKGTARFPGKAALLSGLARVLSTQPEAREAYALLQAARQLGGAEGKVRADLEPVVDRMRKLFLSGALESKPLGFYTWSPELESIFRQDRLLQSELSDSAIVQALVNTLRSDAGLRESYEGYLALVSRLTNPFSKPDLRPFLTAFQSRPADGGPPFPCFFPPSVSHEGKLAERLLGDRPIPEGFSLVDEMIGGIRAGTLNLEPTKASGWYDYQTWSHEPLVIPETTSEGQRLSLAESYRKELLELFKGAQALVRETHVKHLDIARLGMALGPEIRRTVVEIAPELTVEPIATLYHRRALGYRFVRGILEGAFGATGLRQMRRLTPDGPTPGDLDTELADIEALFRGAYTSVAAQIGMPPDPSAGNAADAKRFAGWADSLATDADLGRDTRMMVPIFYDLGRKMTKVWVFLGWVACRLDVDFATPPAAQVFDSSRPITLELGRFFGKTWGKHLAKEVELDFVSESHMLLRPVTAEVYVTRLLNRDQFQVHCDRLKTRSAILSELR